MELPADPHAFRAIILKIQDCLTDDDRERLHFFLGSDVPKRIRDNPSLTGTLELVESLFEQDKINENDFTFLIDAFDEIRCFDAVRILQGYRRQMQDGGQRQSQQSLPSILTQEPEIDKMNCRNFLLNDTLNQQGKDYAQVNDTNRIFANPKVLTRTKKRRALAKKINLIFLGLFVLLLAFTIGGYVFLIKIYLLIQNMQKSNSMPSNQRSNTKYYNQLNEQSIIIQRMLQRLSQSMNISGKSIFPSFSPDAQTVAGGINPDKEPTKFTSPTDIFIDQHQTVFIVDHRDVFVQPRGLHSTITKLISEDERLYRPTTLVIEERTDSLIIADNGHRQVTRWSRRTGGYVGVIVPNITCWGLAWGQNGDLYISDSRDHAIRRHKLGEEGLSTVAGGCGEGAGLNQLNKPGHIYVDEDDSVYVSDHENHRVMKWRKGAREGSIVAGGRGPGDALEQLNSPSGILVDQLGSVYIADTKNHRIVRWLRGATEGQVVVGGRGAGSRPVQLDQPTDIVFNRENNLFVIDQGNHRIQLFLNQQSN